VEIRDLDGLLRLVGVREFDPLAAFVNPSLSLVVKDLVCPHCNFTTEVDLCSDLQLMEEQTLLEKQVAAAAAAAAAESAGDPSSIQQQQQQLAVGSGSSARWRCGQCQQGLDMAAVEGSLVQRVNNLSMAFQLQDLQCGKCKQVRADPMRETCACSGPWAFTESLPAHKHKLQPFLNVSKFYKLAYLQETVESAYACYLR
jgi:DNA polymerase epsilon subunit 1